MSVTTKVVPGAEYGRLTAIRDSGQRKGGQVVWLCRCSCGNETEVTSRNLTAERTKSCGCLGGDIRRAMNKANAVHDLPTEVATLAESHGLTVSIADGPVGWNSAVTVFNPTCGHERRTNVTEFLKRPTACRRCSKRKLSDELAATLRRRGITLKSIAYHADAGNASVAHCSCDFCGEEFSRSVGELSSGNRGCPGCVNIQERYIRVILTANFGGAFQIRVRPKWMGGLELDGWNEEVVIDGKTLAFEYNGRYWHRGDTGDLSKSERKLVLCADNGVILLVVWAPVDRPSIDELMVACQKAVDAAGLERRLVLPSDEAVTALAGLVPARIRQLLAAFDHEAIAYDQDPDRRGHVLSKCLLSGQTVSQAISSLDGLNGCRHCQAHPSRAGRRTQIASDAATKQWSDRRARGTRRSSDKISDEVVAFVRTNAELTGDALVAEVAKRFGVEASASGLQYARSGKTHRHLDALHPPVRKAASNYGADHPAVSMAQAMRREGLSFDKISDRLFGLGHGTLSGKRFSAAQVRNFCLLAPPARPPEEHR